MLVTQSAIQIQWEAPANNGGCLIEGYRIYVDDGNNGAFTLRYDLSQPFTTAYSIDMSDTLIYTVGNTYRVQIGTYNNVGEVKSDSVAVILASVPSTPSPPTSQSDGSYLKVIMSPPSSDGGSPVLSYQLQVRYQTNEDWVVELGATDINLQLTFTVQREVSQGQWIEARYRCENMNGWSLYSTSAFLQMVGPPIMPERPFYIASTGTTITLGIVPVNDNNGAFVTKYYLFRDAGDYSSAIDIPVSGYNGVDLTYTVTSLTPGVMYRFSVQAQNDAGMSPVSYETIVVAAQLPQPPTTLQKITALSNKTSIAVQWTASPDTETETTGYILYMAQAGSQNFSVVYYGYNRPLTLLYTVTGLRTGVTY